MKPKVSVVIPTYNEEKNISKCLKALANQTINRKEYEIIIVDGKSSDNTLKIAKKIADKVIIQKSKGIGGARNDGFNIAHADILATTDADCTVPLTWIETIEKGFLDEGVVCLFGPVRPMEKGWQYKYMIGMNNLLFLALHNLGIFSATIGSNTMFRKRDFMKAGGYRKVEAGDDYEIGIRMRRLGKIKFDKRLCVNFSMRRIKKFGALGTVVSWTLNSISLITNKRLSKKNYSRQVYD